MNWVKSFAPGRINLIGEHTDYNEGFVMPGAIEAGTTFLIKRNNTRDKLRFTALQLEETVEADLGNLHPMTGWSNYLLGTLDAMHRQKPGVLAGFDCEFSGNVPIGAGMSSSAALGCSFALGVNALFDMGFSKPELARCVQSGDHNFVGVKSGIMDQFISMMGKKDSVMKLDCRDLSFEYHKLELKDYQLILLNTNVSHQLADSAYNQRRAQCESAVAAAQKEFPGINSLRDLSLEQLSNMASKMPANVFEKAKFVIEENARVEAVKKVLETQDFQALGALLYASHQGLRDAYEVSCAELDYLVDWTRKQEGILGARMMGGGFGGCTINLIKKDFPEEKIEELKISYQQTFGHQLDKYSVTLGDGAHIVDFGN